MLKDQLFKTKRIAVWQLVFWARKVLGTFEKLGPEADKTRTSLHSRSRTIYNIRKMTKTWREEKIILEFFEGVE